MMMMAGRTKFNKKGGYQWRACDVALLSLVMVCAVAAILVGVLDATGRFPPERFYKDKMCKVDNVVTGPTTCCKQEVDQAATSEAPDAEKKTPKEDPDCPARKGLMVNIKYEGEDGTDKSAMLHHNMESRDMTPQHTFADCEADGDVQMPRKRYRRQSIADPEERSDRDHDEGRDPEHRGDRDHHDDRRPEHHDDRRPEHHDDREPEHREPEHRDDREPEHRDDRDPEHREPEHHDDAVLQLEGADKEATDPKLKSGHQKRPKPEDDVYHDTSLFHLEKMYKRLASTGTHFSCMVDMDDAEHAVIAPTHRLIRKYRHVVWPLTMGLILLAVLVSRRLCCARKVVNHVSKKREVYKVPEPWMTTAAVTEKDPSVLGDEAVPNLSIVTTAPAYKY